MLLRLAHAWWGDQLHQRPWHMFTPACQADMTGRCTTAETAVHAILRRELQPMCSFARPSTHVYEALPVLQCANAGNRKRADEALAGHVTVVTRGEAQLAEVLADAGAEPLQPLTANTINVPTWRAVR